MQDKTNKKLLANVSLIAVAVIWGGGFIAVEAALKLGLSPGHINFLRSFLAALIILPFCIPKLKNLSAKEWISGLIAGIFMTAGFIFQTVGQRYTTPSNTAFLTSLNVILVPFIGWVFTKRRPQKRHITAAVLSLFGVFLLIYSFTGTLSFGMGDIFVVMCAFFFACHIAYLGKVSSLCNARLLTMVQLAVCSLLSLAYSFVFEGGFTYQIHFSGLLAVLYLALNSGVCFFLQAFAQKRTPVAQTAVILSMEGLFGSLFSLLLGFESFSLSLALGGGIILFSVILTELPFKNKGFDSFSQTSGSGDDIQRICN